MLSIAAFLNKEKIEILRIHNTEKMDKRGRHIYEAWSDINPEKKVVVAHLRRNGWRKLGIKVLEELEK